jgi:hypothetical protein
VLFEKLDKVMRKLLTGLQEATVFRMRIHSENLHVRSKRARLSTVFRMRIHSENLHVRSKRAGLSIAAAPTPHFAGMLND